MKMFGFVESHKVQNTVPPCPIRLNHLITSRALNFSLLICHGEKGGVTEGRVSSFSEQTML